MFSAASSFNVMQNQVLGSLSYLASQSSTSTFLSARASTSGSFAHKKTSVTKDGNAVSNSVSAYKPDILSILSPFECNGNSVYGNQSPTPKIAFSREMSNGLSKVSNSALMSEIGSLINGQSVENVMKMTCLQRSPASLLPRTAVQLLCQAVKDSCMRPSTRWRESHISSYSFNTNKHGPLFATSSLLSLNNSYGQTIRSFKTVRTIEQEGIRNKTMRERLRNKIVSPEPSTNPGAIKLKSLLGAESSAQGQIELKVAFAEGYLAGDTEAKKIPESRSVRWARAVQLAVSGFVALVFLSVVLNALGVRINFINFSANEVQPEEITVSFEDVRGVEEAKQELEEIVEFLRCPEKFTSLGAELPKGALLVGPPGTGKTLLARAVAGEAGVPFFHAAGPEFDEILVGQGARRVRDLFRAAKARAPCVIFIDEIDSIGAKRTNSMLHPYANQTINQLLAEMDGFHKNEGVIVLGATNRRDDLDKALLRPGRFDVEVQVCVPDLAGRREIFEYYLSRIKIGQDVEVGVMARGTTGFTGADIKNVVNQAALRAAAELVDFVSMKHLESARDKVLMGPEKKSRIPDEEVNMVTAYHEGGHTLVSHYTQHCHPLHKVTIIPRGPSLGHTAYIPAKEQYNVTRAQMLATLDSLMGGRAAEELIFGPDMVTSGASSDLKQATSLATHMVKDFGMSDRVGLRTFDSNSSPFMGGGDPLSTSTKEAIDFEIKNLLTESYDRARTILRTHAKEHKALAEALLKYETLDADDIKAILDGRPVIKEI